MIIQVVVVIAVGLWLSLAHANESPLSVRRNAGQQATQGLDYKAEVLQLLLEKSKTKYGPYTIEDIPTKGMTQSRVFREMQNGKIDVTTSMTDVSRESLAIPVRYCIYKGLLGVRVGMGTAPVVEALNRVQTRNELNQIEIGQVFDWPDYAIQTDAGLKVTRLTDFSAGVQRLQNGTVQLFPLGIVEVLPQAKARGLSVISTWAIAYPTAYYIFVSKNRPELAERLQYGFEVAIRDRSFDALFNRRVGPLIAAADLEHRKLFHIANPYLPKATPLERKELWHPLVLNKLQ